ncbi:hypothetical protein AgCh_023018 [Apium graveolens]
MGDNNVNLPPGFRFSPSDEELVVHFLQRKASRLPCHPNIIPDLDLYPCDPWDLDGKAMEEERKWYFYSRRTRTRVTSSGFWNPIGEEPILSSKSSSKRKVIGIKKCYVFCVGEPDSEGIKTNWIMQEFSLCDYGGSSSSARRKSKNDHGKCVLCRVYEHKSYGEEDDEQELSCMDELFLSLDDDYDEICSSNYI